MTLEFAIIIISISLYGTFAVVTLRYIPNVRTRDTKMFWFWILILLLLCHVGNSLELAQKGADLHTINSAAICIIAEVYAMYYLDKKYGHQAHIEHHAHKERQELLRQVIPAHMVDLTKELSGNGFFLDIWSVKDALTSEWQELVEGCLLRLYYHKNDHEYVFACEAKIVKKEGVFLSMQYHELDELFHVLKGQIQCQSKFKLNEGEKGVIAEKAPHFLIADNGTHFTSTFYRSKK